MTVRTELPRRLSAGIFLVELSLIRTKEPIKVADTKSKPVLPFLVALAAAATTVVAH